MQLDRDKEARHHEEVTLERQRESRKVLEYLQQRQQHRDDDVRDLKSFQSTHIKELKERTTDCDAITAEVARLQHRKNSVSEELAQLRSRHKQQSERDAAFSGAHNVRRIKMVLKKRSDTVRQDLRDDIQMLDRIEAAADERLRAMRQTLQRKFDREALIYEQLEAMYESEAKEMLQRQESIWLQEIGERRVQLDQILSEKVSEITDRIHTKQKTLRAMVEMKEAHLLAIENANKRLKDLMIDQRVDEKKANAVNIGDGGGGKIEQQNVSSSSSSGRTSTDSSVSKYDDMGVKMAPKYGRKKIAWT